MDADFSNDIPSTLTSSVTDAVINLIHETRLVPNDSLPSEGEFAQKLGVDVASYVKPSRLSKHLAS